MPVWDKEVLKNLGLKPPLYSDKNRLNKTKRLYVSIVDWYKSYLNTEKSKEAISEFDKKFPSSGIPNTKKIDLILWQTRENKELAIILLYVTPNNRFLSLKNSNASFLSLCSKSL